ncbi:MAG: SIMPL domain-containing protein [Pseudomonadota bacterium]
MRRLIPYAVLASLLWPVALCAEAIGTLTVTGAATLTSVPDQAILSLGVTTTGASAATAMAANSDAASAVMARLIAAHVAERDMQTTGLSVNPNWVVNAAGNAQDIQGYTASTMLSVRIAALDTAGSILDAAIADGANTLNGLTFGLSDPRPVEDEARKAAVADALARAQILAEAAGEHLGAIVSITEGGGGQQPMPMLYKAAADRAVPLAAGEVGVSAEVTIVWQLLP